MSEYYQQYFCSYNEDSSLIIEDDGKVAYAYLLKGNGIISDVWLYNQQRTPDTTDWTNKDDMPFLNPKNYILDNRIFSPIKDDSDVEIEWSISNQIEKAKIYIRNELIAILVPNLFPGYSSLVYEDGLLAKIIINIDYSFHLL